MSENAGISDCSDGVHPYPISLVASYKHKTALYYVFFCCIMILIIIIIILVGRNGTPHKDFQKLSRMAFY